MEYRKLHIFVLYSQEFTAKVIHIRIFIIAVPKIREHAGCLKIREHAGCLKIREHAGCLFRCVSSDMTRFVHISTCASVYILISDSLFYTCSI